MRNLLTLMGAALGRRVQAVLGALDVWAAPWLRVRTAVRDGVRACEAWLSALGTLTTVAWPACEANPWREGPLSDAGLQALARRLEDISRLRRCGEGAGACGCACEGVGVDRLEERPTGRRVVCARLIPPLAPPPAAARTRRSCR